MKTMKDIAVLLGISVNAVSLALNDRKGVSEKTRIKVLETAKTLGYLDKKTRYAHTFGNHHLGVLLQDIYRSDLGFYGEVLYSLEKEAKNHYYDILLHHFNDANMTVPDFIVKRRAAGVIVLGKISDKNISALLPFPMIVIDHAPRMLNINCIRTDNISGGFIAADYLISRGFHTVGFFGDPSYSISVRERYYGFLEALYRNGIVDFNKTDAYVKKYSLLEKVEPFIMNMDAGSIRKKLQKKILPSAFFCSNDQAAVTMIHALELMNITVPKDISIIGFDNGMLVEKINPKLTSINVNRELMGRKAVQRLIRLIEEDDTEAEHTILQVELVERDSVKI
ncbi:MAG: LacI family transcriptional regulator [Spirochaetaceae bacterium]|jgi:DNA-binding LacI/PurR family transcriptional regulator|nr:LacI family transcriptional regulator [Spirochaetaceae bacterium]